MKVTISESQFIRMVNNSKGWGLIGINEKYEKYSPEEEDDKIERIINDVKRTGELNSTIEHRWLYNKVYYGNKKEKFRIALNQIREIQEEFENKKIKRIIDDVKRTGKFNSDKQNPDYVYLYKNSKSSEKKEKFEIALNEIREILEEFEDEKIKRIIDDVKRTGEFIRNDKNPDYLWLYTRRKKEKFENALNKITELQVIIGKRREWWGENTVKQILEQMGFTDIPPLGQHRIDDCRSSLTCKPYKFDVYLPYTEDNEKIYEIITKNENGVLPKTGIIFEYDGGQHFKPIDYFGGDKIFIQRINNDREKNSYCKNKNIKLVRIPYTSKTRDDIKRGIVSALKDPNNFILTGDYPKLGWNK
jgi:uncharacterized protein YaaR (DUF327 family)